MAGAFLEADLDEMLSTEDFADSFVVTAGPLTGQSYSGIFQRPFSDPMGVAGSDPVFATKSSHPLVTGTVGELKGKIWRLKPGEPNGVGVTRWPLTGLV